LAVKQQVSITELVRQSIDKFIESSEGISLKEERIKRALSIVGRFHSGSAGDVSARHDDYLDEVYGSW
jgi:hypothetical protein